MSLTDWLCWFRHVCHCSGLEHAEATDINGDARREKKGIRTYLFIYLGLQSGLATSSYYWWKTSVHERCLPRPGLEPSQLGAEWLQVNALYLSTLRTYVDNVAPYYSPLLIWEFHCQLKGQRDDILQKNGQFSLNKFRWGAGFSDATLYLYPCNHGGPSGISDSVALHPLVLSERYCHITDSCID